MGGLAQILVEKGHQVTGSDKQFYPPMSDQLYALGVEMIEGFEESDLPSADLYVIGNALSRGNPSVEYILTQKLEYTSGPKMMGEIIRDRKVIAVSGTHGKTSTSFLICEIFQFAGIDVGYLVGGVSDSFKNSARLGTSNLFVIEADEYDSAFFDKRSKFIHYSPTNLIINNIEFDSKNDLDELISILPKRIQDYINSHDEKEYLVEVILDLGKLPEVRFPNSQETIGEGEVSHVDLQSLISRVSEFGDDNLSLIHI